MDFEETIKKNKINEELYESLKTELPAMQREIVFRKCSRLRVENETLKEQVEATRTKLILLETRNGKKQICVPNQNSFLFNVVPGPKNDEISLKELSTADATTEKKQPYSSKKKLKKDKLIDSAPVTDKSVDIGCLDLRVGKIVDVEHHPNADSLYLEKIDCGEALPRTVISGLVKFVPLDQMKNRMVVVLCNLKPVKMRGINSEAMVMCASTADEVEVLSPPAGAVPGDIIQCNGYDRRPDEQINHKNKIFEICAQDLRTNTSLVACYKGSALYVPEKGNIVAQSLKNVAIK